MTEQTLKDRLSVKEKWLRLIYMIIFFVIAWIVRIVVWAITALQFIYTLFVGSPLPTLLPFSNSLSKYIYQIARFLMYGTEEKPFPFTHWPEPDIIKEPKAAKKKIEHKPAKEKK